MLQTKKLAVASWHEGVSLGTPVRYNGKPTASSNTPGRADSNSPTDTTSTIEQPAQSSQAPSYPQKDAGALVTPPRSPVHQGDAKDEKLEVPASGGLMQLTVTITESDPTNRVAQVKQVAKFIEDQTPAVVGAVKQQLGIEDEGQPSATKPASKPAATKP